MTLTAWGGSSHNNKSMDADSDLEKSLRAEANWTLSFLNEDIEL